MKKMLMFLVIVGLISSCNLKRNDAAKVTLDSLRIQLDRSHHMAETMVEVGVLLDSIDANRKLLHTRMVEGAGYESYVARLRDLNQYVKRTENKITALEKTARKANDAAFLSAMKKLKADLEVRNHELAALTQLVDQYKNENDNLLRTVNLQKSELQEKSRLVTINQDKAARLDEQVQQLLVKSKLDEGESYFARAVATEETANRTHFAPRKKKNTLRQAIELYKMAEFHGKENAKYKVTALEEKLKKGNLFL